MRLVISTIIIITIMNVIFMLTNNVSDALGVHRKELLILKRGGAGAVGGRVGWERRCGVGVGREVYTGCGSACRVHSERAEGPEGLCFERI